jgi:3-oxoacyl-[acyl-carrier protein] reductase
MTDWQRQPGFDLTGKKALVVGCANGAGRGIALGLAEAGADVAITSATLDGDEIMEAKRISKAVAQLGRATISQGWDVTLPGNIQVGLKQIIRDFGHPTILVFNADHTLAKPLEKVTDAEFGHSSQANLGGAFYASRSFVRELPEGAGGRIIYIASLFGERGVEGVSAYAAPKAGLTGLMAALSQELGSRAITVNCIETGWMEWTPGRGPADIAQNRLLRFIPLKRFGMGEDLAPLAVLLASDAGGYLSGQVFRVDGGISGHL